MSIESVNPHTGRLLRRFTAFAWAKTQRILGQAHRAAPAWAATTFAHRAGVLRRAAALLRERQDALARLMALEMGKPITDAAPRPLNAPPAAIITPSTPRLFWPMN